MVTKKFNGGDYPRIYRPGKISEVYGQEKAKRIIGNSLDNDTLANALLFYGISGTGKTTMARIVAMGLNCEKGSPTSEPCCQCASCRLVLSGNHMAFQEFNAGYFRGIDHMRNIAGDFDCAPMGNFKKKVINFDECHRLTKDAQNLLLKVVEDSHADNHFIFCSTEREAIIETLRNRCMPIEFKRVVADEIRRLLIDVCRQEEIAFNSDVLDGIIRKADGMPRNALFGLQEAIVAGELEKVSEVFEKKIESVKSAFKLCR